MKPEDVDRLPVGPNLRRRRLATLEEARRGTGARWIEWDEARPMKAQAFKVGDPMFVVDSEGQRWVIGEWADGEKFKEPWFG